MIIYYSLFAFTVFSIALLKKTTSFKTIDTTLGIQEKRLGFTSILFVLIPMVFFLGMRSNFGDTINYIDSFESQSIKFTLENLKIDLWGFSILQRFCKAFLFTDANVWLILMIIISIIPIVNNVSKYSPDPTISFFVFFASAEFTFLINGSRQFIAVCIVFYGLKFLINKNFLKYAIITLIAMSFHQTALIMFLAYPVANMQPFKRNMLLFSLVTLLMTFFAAEILQFTINSFIFNSAYGHYSSVIFGREGVNIIRVAIHWVPILLAFIYRKKIWEINDRCMDVCINLSLINALVFTFAGTIGGNLTGRMAEYFTIFNLLTYPMIFKRCVSKSTRSWLIPLFVIGYIGFFVYQMKFSWNAFYESEALGIFC